MDKPMKKPGKSDCGTGSPMRRMAGEKVIPRGNKPTSSPMRDALRGAMREALGKPKK